MGVKEGCGKLGEVQSCRRCRVVEVIGGVVGGTWQLWGGGVVGGMGSCGRYGEF